MGATEILYKRALLWGDEEMGAKSFLNGRGTMAIGRSLEVRFVILHEPICVCYSSIFSRI